ncbi:hypothetical protein HYDPIDRAFT_34972 [Hydnomerulius pinastri MD-312]|uniref:Uncharacterized protein n=1 Tax=Hydnomerulius pinastri MD-312 TaxID=994086 RepID=A0A0C2PR93_9AGAM|nr:hypothetical protein HYDPIDRAFT_34972 [Hydnomerulius pinastri MD-312]
MSVPVKPKTSRRGRAHAASRAAQSAEPGERDNSTVKEEQADESTDVLVDESHAAPMSPPCPEILCSDRRRLASAGPGGRAAARQATYFFKEQGRRHWDALKRKRRKMKPEAGPSSTPGLSKDPPIGRRELPDSLVSMYEVESWMVHEDCAKVVPEEWADEVEVGDVLPDDPFGGCAFYSASLNGVSPLQGFLRQDQLRRRL